jgi:hypothetical protein
LPGQAQERGNPLRVSLLEKEADVSTTPVWVNFKLNSLSWTGDASLRVTETIEFFFLWTVFFKIDGDTVSAKLVGTNIELQGVNGGAPAATVFTTPGDSNDLGSTATNNSVSIPEAIGTYRTKLTPILAPGFNTSAGGFLGCAGILMNQGGIPADDVPPGHTAFNTSMQQALNNLVTTLSIPVSSVLSSNPPPPVTPAEVQAIEAQVQQAIHNAISNALSTGNKFLIWLGEEQQPTAIASPVYLFSASDLASSPPAGIVLENGFPTSPTFGWLTEDPAVQTAQFTFHGVVTGDPYPLSLRRILTRLNLTSLRTAMTQSASFKPADSMASWMTNVAA